MTGVLLQRMRRFGVLAAAALLLGGVAGPGSAAAVSPGQATNATDFSSVVLPGDVGQSGIQVYVDATGHTLRGMMLDYWRANGAASVYGNPISEPYASADGYYSQAFENGIFQYRPEYADTNDPAVRLAPVGQTLLTTRLDQTRRDGRRAFGGGDRRSAAWRPVDPNGSAAAKAANGGIYDQTTGHTVTGDFADWYNGHEGAFYLGSPLSQPIREGGATVQYFEGGVLTRAGGTAHLEPVGRMEAAALGIDTRPVERGDLPSFSEDLFQTAPNPDPEGSVDSPGRKWIEVSLSQERLWAYQGDTLIMSTLVSTGLAPNFTAPGLFHVRLKFEKQTMTGFTNGTGEVVALGDSSPGGGAVHYEVPDVPNVMYFNTQAEALHGTYWHNNFGNPMSHGCVNLPLDVAAWMYGWAPIGTEVWIHE